MEFGDEIASAPADLCLGFRLALQTLLLRNKEHTAGSRQVVTEEIVGVPSGGDSLLK